MITLEQLIDIRLRVIRMVEPKSAVEDVLFYTYLGSDALSIATLPIEGLRGALDKELVRKALVRKILSGAFLQAVCEDPHLIEHLAIFSIDALSKVDHCFYFNFQTLYYEYCVYNFFGNILLTFSYTINKETHDIKQLDFALSNNSEYYPSPRIEDLFTKYINSPILEDPRTTSYFAPLGYSAQEIRSRVLDFGLADFDQPYHTLTAADRVNLYCYFNLKKHYFTSYALIERFLAALPDTTTIVNGLNFIDIGCGPLTSALALGDIFQEKTGMPLRINYYGIDTAQSMIRKASEFSKSGLFDPASTFRFATTLEDAGFGSFIKNNPYAMITIVNCSYLFASKTLDLRQLWAEMQPVEDMRGEYFLLYQNATQEPKNTSWKAFQSLYDLITIYSAERRIFYHNRRSVNAEKKEENVRFDIAKIITWYYAI